MKSSLFSRLSLLVIVSSSLSIVFFGCDKKDEAASTTTTVPAAKVDSPAVDANAHAHADAAPADAGKGTAPVVGSVSFIFPQDGSTVFSTSKAAFHVNGKVVTRAGEGVGDEGKGHHHLIIDGAPVPKGQVVPLDDKHMHFGEGQTSTDLKLTPGEHTLTLQFGDAAHMSFGDEMSTTIKVRVVEDPKEKPSVSFKGLKDGAKVRSPLKVRFGVQGMKLRPASEDILDKTSGHHHLIIDDQPTPFATVVAANATHIHYGKAQKEADIELTKGQHTLTLQYADGAHMSYGSDLSATVIVNVE